MSIHMQNVNMNFLRSSIVVYCLCTSELGAIFLLTFPSVKVVCIYFTDSLLILETLKVKEQYKQKAYFTIVLKWGVHI